MKLWMVLEGIFYTKCIALMIKNEYSLDFKRMFRYSCGIVHTDDHRMLDNIIEAVFESVPCFTRIISFQLVVLYMVIVHYYL